MPLRPASSAAPAESIAAPDRRIASRALTGVPSASSLVPCCACAQLEHLGLARRRVAGGCCCLLIYRLALRLLLP